MKNMKNLKMLIKSIVFICAGLVPALVFKLYAQPGATYNALFSIIIWVSLALIDTNKFQEEKNE